MIYKLTKIIIIFFSLTGQSYSIIDSVRYEVYANKYLLGTLIEGKIITNNISQGREILYKAFKEIEKIDSLYDYNKKNSILYKLNHSYDTEIKMDNESYNLFKRAVNYSKKYDGLFDITIGIIVDLWGFNSEKEIILPDSSEISLKKSFVNYENIIFNDNKKTIFIKKGTMLDLGGIAKGYAVNKASEIIQKNGIKDYYIDAGGDLFVSGLNAENQPWHIAIKHPRKQNSFIASFKATNIGIATSGDYERYALINGIRYHHILDPRTGYPGFKSQSVTVLMDDVEHATVIAKYIFLLGYDLFEKTPLATKIPYFIVDSDGFIHFNDLFKNKYDLKIIE